MRLLMILAAGVTMLSSQAMALSLPDGAYDCVISSYRLGQIELSNGVFRGPAHDGNFQGDYPFEVTDAGTINWGGPLGGIDSGGNTLVGTVIKDAGGGRLGFDIQIQNDSGNFQTVSCSPM